jgi:hypothetical protein
MTLIPHPRCGADSLSKTALSPKKELVVSDT